MFLRRSRPTLIAALSIPASIISAFAAIKYMGYTLNTITLLALTLVVGIVIDDAVIVIENIFRLLEDKAPAPEEAAIEGTREIGLAVLATTLSLIAVFLPIGFMGGIVGRFMGSFGITMSFAIFISLIVAFTITPMLCARWLRVPKGDEVVVPVHGLNEHAPGVYGGIEWFYMTMLRWAMGHRMAMLVIIALTVMSSVPLGAHRQQELPAHRRRRPVRGPGASARGLVARLLQVAPRVDRQAGPRPRRASRRPSRPLGADPLRTQNYGSIYVKMKPLDQRTVERVRRSQNQVRSDILPPVRGAEDPHPGLPWSTSSARAATRPSSSGWAGPTSRNSRSTRRSS